MSWGYPEKAVKISNTTIWRFLNTHSGNAFFNMAVDEAVLNSISRKESPPTFRVYGWNPPAISFGYAQRISREINIEKCAESGIDIVRRPTGGRAVLHWNEPTYSVLCPAEDSLLGGPISEAYRKISISLVSALRGLGTDARFEAGKKPVPSPRGRDLSLPCFSSTAQFEITIEGRKIVGSAQRRFNGMLLQHGSLLIGSEHKNIVNYLPEGSSELACRFREELDTRTISLQEAIGGTISYSTVSQAMLDGLRSTLDASLIEGPLTSSELSEVEELSQEKYSTDAWNFRDRKSDLSRASDLS